MELNKVYEIVNGITFYWEKFQDKVWTQMNNCVFWCIISYNTEKD